MRLLPVLALALACATAAAAEEGRFAVSIAGFGAGTISFQGSEANGRYEASGQVASKGLASRLYPAQISVAVRGGVSGNRYAPAHYKETAIRKGKTKHATFRYANATPEVTKNPPDKNRKSYHAEAKDQKGTVDPMTAAFAILRDRPADLACNLDISPFDGRERTRIRMRGGTRKGDQLTCPGTYSRIDGFSDREMAEKVHWPFSVVYTVLPDGTHRVTEVVVPTTLGKVRMQRR
ncbi:DUF3108 domain-containing protein [Aliiruegeria lutimaris]|uniref:DUF3108 domain-containing protein n=1 Tax=Aliiruegeria lutimaris TaxID=571298 RepID=A0A1G9IAQ1_9RHOB|nr:DUF3108 domain-containing protein [Aliiruegeria lutimaris]SDL22192.1 Protein of unknown function [Aliiruegeria lutimaris]